MRDGRERGLVYPTFSLGIAPKVNKLNLQTHNLAQTMQQSVLLLFGGTTLIFEFFRGTEYFIETKL